MHGFAKKVNNIIKITIENPDRANLKPCRSVSYTKLKPFEIKSDKTVQIDQFHVDR